MKILTPSQCRAARAILDINRNQLAELSSVSAPAIGNFETGQAEPRAQSLAQLRLALEAAGVEFLDTDGVRERRAHIRTYEGKDIHRQLLDEIYNDLKDAGGEILIKGLNEDRWASGDDEVFLKYHIDRLLASNVTERLLVSEEHTLEVVHKHWYRKIPKEYFSNQTVWIFKNKIGIVSWGDIEKLIIIESPELYHSEVRQFNCIWDKVAQPLT